jgi:hypothetical protein
MHPHRPANDGDDPLAAPGVLGPDFNATSGRGLSQETEPCNFSAMNAVVTIHQQDADVSPLGRTKIHGYSRDVDRGRDVHLA